MRFQKTSTKEMQTVVAMGYDEWVPMVNEAINCFNWRNIHNIKWTRSCENTSSPRVLQLYARTIYNAKWEDPLSTVVRGNRQQNTEQKERTNICHYAGKCRLLLNLHHSLPCLTIVWRLIIAFGGMMEVTPPTVIQSFATVTIGDTIHILPPRDSMKAASDH